MKIKLTLIGAALIFYCFGLLSAVAFRIDIGAILILLAFAIIFSVYVTLAYVSFKGGSLLKLRFLSYSLALIVVAEIFLQAFSIAIDRSLFSSSGFYFFHVFTGFLLTVLFYVYSLVWIKRTEEKDSHILLILGLTGSVSLTLIGFLSFAGIVQGAVRFIYYGFVFLTFFYFLFFLLRAIRKGKQSENRTGLIIAALVVAFWFLRWEMAELVRIELHKVIIQIGFVIFIILPIAILFVKKFHFVTVFIIYTALVELYFIAYNREFKYLVQTGGKECVGYDDATEYSVVSDPGISVDELFKNATNEEIDAILNEWENKDFSPQDVKVEHRERRTNGDSINIVSHRVNGQKHYGLIRIPAGIDVHTAPILLSLPGGGSDIDVTDSESVFKISSRMCRDVLNRYITIIPTFRGDIIRGHDFCFRAEGYTGDVWLGAAEDAVSLLQVVKQMYSRNEDTNVIAMGISRGATVGLIIGGLTDQLNYIISISTHTDFHNIETFQNERVGSDFARIFFTPKASPQQIRKRMIASSPYYFSNHLPNFEIHQGTADDRTTELHVKRLEEQLRATGRNDSTYSIYYYEGKGHGFDDDAIVCKRLKDFSER